MTIAESTIADFTEHGYTVLHAALDQVHCGSARSVLYDVASSRTGWRSPKKLHIEDILDLDSSVRQLVGAASIQAFADSVMSHPVLWGARFRAPLPGYGEQVLHTDDERDYGGPLRLLTILLPLDPFLSNTGATRVLPCSHISPPKRVPADPMTRTHSEIIVLANPGDAIAISGRTWHSGTRNKSHAPRGAVAISFLDTQLWPDL